MINNFWAGCLPDPNMPLSKNCRELSFWGYSLILCSVNYAKHDKSPKIVDSCIGNILNHFSFSFVDQNMTFS